jgi:hypothetical protein
MNNTYIKLLIDKSSTLDVDMQKQILKFAFETFVQYQKDTLFIYESSIKRVKSKQAFITMLRMSILLDFKIDIVYFDKSKKKKYLIKVDELYDTLTTVNSYDLLIYESNLFADKQTIIKDDRRSVIKVVANKLHLKEVSNLNIEKSDYNSILNDYKQHFKYFDELLDLIVDMRFAKDKKASFLHLRVKSDWGKSFLSGLLKNLEIAIEIDYHNLMNKGANDISPIQVRNSFVMIVDEFNTFSQEMKKLSHSFTFAPKFGMSETVELYLKILLSAEKSPSFTGGVDDQIVNRVMSFDIEDDKAKKLVEREIYLKFGNAKYMKALEYYSYNRIKKRIDEYMNMNEFKAYKTADDRVRITYKQHKMNVESLVNNVANILNDTIYDIANSNEKNDYLNNFKSDIYTLQNNEYFIANSQKLFEAILKVKTSENEFKKMRYKLTDIFNVLNVVQDRRNKRFYIDGTQKRGLIIKIEKEKIIEVEKYDKEGNLVDVKLLDAENGEELF